MCYFWPAMLWLQLITGRPRGLVHSLLNKTAALRLSARKTLEVSGFKDGRFPRRQSCPGVITMTMGEQMRSRYHLGSRPSRSRQDGPLLRFSQSCNPVTPRAVAPSEARLGKALPSHSLGLLSELPSLQWKD